MLAEVHRWWMHEALEGVFPEFVVTTSDGKMKWQYCVCTYRNRCWLPVIWNFGLTNRQAKVEWLECQTGELQSGVLNRIPHRASTLKERSVGNRRDSNRWQYRIWFGFMKAGVNHHSARLVTHAGLGQMTRFLVPKSCGCTIFRIRVNPDQSES
jgi:hypothetical protein